MIHAKNFSSYSKINELTKQRLRGLKNHALKRKENLYKPDELVLYLLADMNAKLDTICFLPNWVHPQRIEKNIKFDKFNQEIPKEFYVLLLGELLSSFKFFIESIASFSKHLKIVESKQIFLLWRSSCEVSGTANIIYKTV